MHKKVYLLGIYILFLFFVVSILAQNVEAKVLPQANKAAQAPVSSVKDNRISISGYMSDRRHLVINFSNLQNASAVSYALTYKTSTQDEGAMGALNLGGSSSQTIKLYFGTCSKNDCREHVGIKNAELDISYTLKSGKKYLREYKIKI